MSRNNRINFNANGFLNAEETDNGVYLQYRDGNGNRGSLSLEQKETESDQEFADRVKSEYENRFVKPLRASISENVKEMDDFIEKMLTEENTESDED